MAWALTEGRPGWTPAIMIRIDGVEVAAGFYGRLIKFSCREDAGQSTDRCTFELDDARNELFVPREKARVEVLLGYRESGIYLTGVYEVQPIKISGGNDGEVLVIQAEAADLRRKHKGANRRSWQDTTFGAIARDVAASNGSELVIPPHLAAIPVPFALQLDGSDIDFLTRLGDEVGAVIKPVPGRIVAAERGAGRSVGGQWLMPITIDRSDCVSEWSFTPHGRPAYGKVSSAWVDQKTGKRHVEEYETGLEGPEFIMQEAYPDKERARLAARSEGQRMTSDTSDGHLTIYGRATAQAGAPVVPRGFRDECVGPWLAHYIEHEVSAGTGFITKVGVKAPPLPLSESAKSKAKKDAKAKPASSGGGSEKSTGSGSGSPLWLPTDYGAW